MIALFSRIIFPPSPTASADRIEPGRAPAIARRSWVIAGVLLSTGGLAISSALAEEATPATDDPVTGLLTSEVAAAAEQLPLPIEAQKENIAALIDQTKKGSWGFYLAKWDYGVKGNLYGDIGKHAEAMAGFYDKDATLLPTLSPGVWKKAGLSAIENYFKDEFLKKKPVLKKVEDGHIELLGIRGGHIFASYQGLYTFEVDKKGGGREDVKARFTFVFKSPDTVQQRWLPLNTKILMHHSSAEPVAAARCIGDANSDGVTDIEDIMSVLLDFGTECE